MRAAAAGLLALFAAAVVVQHGLTPALDPSSNMVSEYARGRWGPLMTAGFTAWTGSLVATGLLLRRTKLVIPLAVASIGALLITVFPTETIAGELPAGASLSLGGRLHDRGGELLLLGFASAMVVDAARVRSVPATPMVALLGVATAALLLPLTGDPWPGLRQRALIFTAVGWQAALLRTRSSRRSTTG